MTESNNSDVEEVIKRTKKHIADSIHTASESQGHTIRSLAKAVGLHHPQIVRLTNGSNYTRDTLLKVLDELDLEIVIRNKR